jgi:hypothetical protein
MSELRMSEAQAENYRLRKIRRETEDHLLDEEWGVDDLDSLELGIFRCVSGEILCDEGDRGFKCGCCENAGLWESVINVEGHTETCGYCKKPAQLVEVVGTWADVKHEARRFADEHPAMALLRRIAFGPEELQPEMLSAIRAMFEEIKRIEP